MFRVEQMNLFVVNIDQATNLNNKYRTPRRSTRPWRFYDLFSKSADICILEIAVITFRSSWSVLIMSTPNPIVFFIVDTDNRPQVCYFAFAFNLLKYLKKPKLLAGKVLHCHIH